MLKVNMDFLIETKEFKTVQELFMHAINFSYQDDIWKENNL